jgi:GT2 family glycosyltransferase
MLALLQNIATLDHASELLEQVVVVNNCSTEDYSAVSNYIDAQKQLNIIYANAPENLGVARGRNYALRYATAPFIIMLDDDAELQNKDCLLNLIKEFEQPKTASPIAIVSFKVLYFDTLELQRNTLPQKKFDQYKDKSFFETYYYAGGAHAIRKSVLDEVGHYPADFFYGMEEYDLSYRIINAGYAIVYTNSVVMLHKESPQGRKPKEEKVQMMWVNKSIVAYKYLPKKYFFSTAIMWSLFYLRATHFNLSGFIAGWKKIWRIPKNQTKNSVSLATVQKLKSLQARLWY